MKHASSTPAAATPARRRKRLAAAALGLAAAVLGVLLAGHGHPGEARVAVAPSSASRVQRAVPVLQTEAADRSPAQVQAIETWKAMRSDYQALAEYPPFSWPLQPGRGDLLHWKQMLTSPAQAFDDRDGEQTVVRFASDMSHVMYGETMTATLEIVRSAGGSEQRLPFTIHSAWVIGHSAGRLMPVVFRDDGAAGDLRANDQLYTLQLRPIDHDELGDEGEFVLHADIERAGLRKAVELAFTAATRRVLEVRSVSDELRDGSLVVKLDADVHRQGPTSSWRTSSRPTVRRRSPTTTATSCSARADRRSSSSSSAGSSPRPMSMGPTWSATFTARGCRPRGASRMSGGKSPRRTPHSRTVAASSPLPRGTRQRSSRSFERSMT